MTGLFNRFFNSESASGWLLLCCIPISLLLANSALASDFARLLAHQTGFIAGQIHLKYSLLTWINDGLMAVFFLLVGLEVKRSFIKGELSGIKKAALPVFAALGGCIVPATEPVPPAPFYPPSPLPMIWVQFW